MPFHSVHYEGLGPNSSEDKKVIGTYIHTHTLIRQIHVVSDQEKLHGLWKRRMSNFHGGHQNTSELSVAARAVDV